MTNKEYKVVCYMLSKNFPKPSVSTAVQLENFKKDITMLIDPEPAAKAVDLDELEDIEDEGE